MFKTIVKGIDKMLWPQRVAKGQICNAGVWPWLAAIAKAIAGGVTGAIAGVGKVAGAIGHGIGGAIGLGGQAATTAGTAGATTAASSAAPLLGAKAGSAMGMGLTKGTTAALGGIPTIGLPTTTGLTGVPMTTSPAIAQAAMKPGLLEGLAQEGLKKLKTEGGNAIMSGAMQKAPPPTDVPLPPGGSMDYGGGGSGAPPYTIAPNAPTSGGAQGSRITPEMLLEMLKVKQKYQGQV